MLVNAYLDSDDRLYRPDRCGRPLAQRRCGRPRPGHRQRVAVPLRPPALGPHIRGGASGVSETAKQAVREVAAGQPESFARVWLLRVLIVAFVLFMTDTVL